MTRKSLILLLALVIGAPLGVFVPSVSATNYGNINIIDDSVMNNTSTMSASQINTFLNSFSGTCLGTNSGFTAPKPLGYSAGGYQYGSNVSAGEAIKSIADRYNLNPQVVMATLEKEQGLISRNGSCHYEYMGDAPATYQGNNVTCGNNTSYTDCSYACRYSGGCVTVAMGYGCPGFCKKTFANFSGQISGASWVLRFAEARAYGQLTGYPGYDSGDEYIHYGGAMTPGYRQRIKDGSSIYYDGLYTDVDGNTMYVTNGSSASMLNYTPFYARSYTDNKLFHTFFAKWFGSTTSNTQLANSLKTSQLPLNTTIHAGDYIVSPDGKFVTVMQYDGNLVVLRGRTIVWSSKTSGNYSAYAIFQGDGNLVIYRNGGVAIWSSGTNGSGANKLTLSDLGILSISSNDAQKWTTYTLPTGLPNTLSSATRLRSSESLMSPNNIFRLIMQGDGNMVLYATNGPALWSSGTDKNPGAFMVLQGDGNMVIYSASGKALWSSNTAGKGTSKLYMQNDGNMVLYNSSNATWSSGTNLSGYGAMSAIGDQLSANSSLRSGKYLRSNDYRYRLVMQADGNLVLRSANGYSALWSSGTDKNPGAFMVLQGDGNMVIYSASGKALWSSNTAGKGTSKLYMQNDGNMVLYNSSNATWSSGTSGKF